MRKDLDWLHAYRQHPLFEKCVSVYCHKGWISLLEETVKYIEYSNRRTDFDLLITQVKPKFGLLVIYIEPQDRTNLRGKHLHEFTEICNQVENITNKSSKMCKICGDKLVTTVDDLQIVNRCLEHFHERQGNFRVRRIKT
jgi:hypothetical protein